MTTVFLDANAVIYWVESKQPWYGNFQNALNTLQQQRGDLQLAISDLSRLECLVKPLREQQLDVVQLYEQFFNHPQLAIQTLTPTVVQTALKIRIAYSIKTPDALQAASAFVFDEQCVFLTADAGFHKINCLNVHGF